MELEDRELRSPFLCLVHPRAQNGEGANNKIGAGVVEIVFEVGEKREGLQSLSQTHFIACKGRV